jgi:steroid delta-isomerase-like uncharacterized protein
MGIEGNKKIAKEFTERMGKGDSAVLDELTTDDFVVHVLFDKGYDVNRDVYKQTNDGGHVSFPDYSLSVDDMIGEGDKVFVLSTKTGTHNGNFLGVPPTGKQINVFRGVVYRLENGKIAETWAMEDMFSHLSQLGVLSTIQEAVQAYNESLK